LWCRWTLRRPWLASAGERILASFFGTVFPIKIGLFFRKFLKRWNF
jgi:hypothetical protein